jgi:F0F1-type ATP synthase alpha subunit
LNKYNASSSDTLNTVISSKIKTKFGAINFLLGDHGDSTYEVDISKTLQKTKMVERSLVTKQLFTGHTRLDLAQPLSQGNVIMFKGERNLGKTRLAVNTINQFL